MSGREEVIHTVWIQHDVSEVVCGELFVLGKPTIQPASDQTLPLRPPVLLVQGQWLVQSTWEMVGAKLAIFLLHPNPPSPVESTMPLYS